MAKHNWAWHFRDLKEEYQKLLIDYKKVLLYKKNVKDETIFEYQKDLKNYFKFLQERELMPIDVNTETIDDYLDSLNVSEGRMKRIVSILNGYYKHLHRRKYVRENPMLYIKKR